jgi:hypothetical protein
MAREQMKAGSALLRRRWPADGTRDPLGRVIRQEWCGCGSLDALVNGNGNRTRWERDVRGRVTRDVRADDVTDTLYTTTALAGSGPSPIRKKRVRSVVPVTVTLYIK